jgi:hypothetical protein
MATALAANDDLDAALETEQTGEDKLEEVFERAKCRFDIAVLPQLEQRSLALAARRFVTIPGAQWEGDFGDFFDDAVKLEINLTKDGLRKIYRDYNENRIVPDFRPAGGKGDEDSAATLDGLHRADSYCFKSQQARDNAFLEGTAGGMGAYRLTNEWADPYDKDSDHQRINPGFAIVDADQRVFFDPDSVLYDKSDAKYGFVITAKQRETFEAQYEDAITDFVSPVPNPVYDWYTPDTVKIAEYYEVEEVTEPLLIMTQTLSGQQERYWESEIDPAELADMKRMGWSVRKRQIQRKRVHKYIISGEEVLADKGRIAGDRIPIVPYYGNRAFVDGVERFEGYVQTKMDVQRLYNVAVSKLAETSSQAPRDIPIFAAQQMLPNLADLWSRQVVERHAYALVEPLVDPSSGQIVSAGPIGKIEAPQIDQATSAVLQIARTDLTEDQQDGSDEAKANTSADALEFAATRVDAKSGIYLDNWRQSVQCEGEIYLSMGADVYYEPGRQVETMAEDGNDGTAVLVQQYTDKATGRSGYRNDFTRGHYKVIVDVTEATATRRDKTVRSSLHVAGVAGQLGNNDLANAALITAVANMDGEGMTDLQKFGRRQAVQMGLAEPTDDEKAQLAQAQQEMAGRPDPQAALIAAKAKEAEASAIEKTASAGLKTAQAEAVGGPDAAPSPPDGLEQVHKVAQVAKTVAETHKLETDTAHQPQKLAIEATNAQTNRMKANHQGMLAGFKALFNRSSR